MDGKPDPSYERATAHAMTIVTTAAQQAVETDGRTSWLAPASCLSPVVDYHGLARRLLMRPWFPDAAAA
jgi:hypothetical protein